MIFLVINASNSLAVFCQIVKKTPFPLASNQCFFYIHWPRPERPGQMTHWLVSLLPILYNVKRLPTSKDDVKTWHNLQRDPGIPVHIAMKTWHSVQREPGIPVHIAMKTWHNLQREPGIPVHIAMKTWHNLQREPGIPVHIAMKTWHNLQREPGIPVHIAMKTWHNLQREPGIPVHIAHQLTRSKEIINLLYQMGITTSYDRVMELKDWIATSLCDGLKKMAL